MTASTDPKVLVQLAMTVQTLNAGGHLKLSDDDLSQCPLGTLGLDWLGNGDLAAHYFPHNEGAPLPDPVALGLAVLVAKAGGTLIVKGRDCDKIPNGTFGFTFTDGGIEFLFRQEKATLQ